MVILWIQGNILRKCQWSWSFLWYHSQLNATVSLQYLACITCHVYKKISFPFFRWNVQNEAIANSAFKIAGGSKHAHMWTLLVVICQQNHRCLPASSPPPPSLCAVYVLNILFFNIYFLHKRMCWTNIFIKLQSLHVACCSPTAFTFEN